MEDVRLKVDADVSGVEEKLKKLTDLSKKFSSTIVGGLATAIKQGKSFKETLKSIAMSLANSALQAGLDPLKDLMATGMAAAFSRFGAAPKSLIAGGQSAVLPFAKGGVIATPNYFPAGNRVGVMGEAGAEAIMPLSRSADGRLGVRMADQNVGASPTIQVNISSPDVESFKRSEAQMTSALSRAVKRGTRNL